MAETLLGQDVVIYNEMMSHLPLFAHLKPQQIAILHDHERGIEQEVTKHASITQVFNNATLPMIDAGTLDIFIIANSLAVDNYDNHFQLLHSNGILVQQSESPFDLTAMKRIQHTLKSAGFQDTYIIQFPQPSHSSGWRAAVLSVKQGVLRRPREKDIFNKTFHTHYYNLDVHKAAFALPEFMRVALASD